MNLIYITRTANSMLLAIVFFLIFITEMILILFVERFTNWWFMLGIVVTAIVFYVISIYHFVRMEFYEQAVIVRHLLKPRNPEQFKWEQIARAEFSGENGLKPHRVAVYFIGRKAPFIFSVRDESQEDRAKVLEMFRSKGVEVVISA